MEKWTMPGFDVLNSQLPLFENHFLEASAGTGKTFAIENIVARLLIEENGPDISQILVVTFTRAATLELKTRIQARLKEILEFCNTHNDSLPFLKPVFEAGEQAVLNVKRRIQTAIAGFDDSKIFTIHAFCFHSLQEMAFEAGIAFNQVEENAAVSELKRLIKDQLRTEISNDLVSPKQFEKLLISSGNNIDQLVSKLLPYISQNIPIQSAITFQEALDRIHRGLEKLKLKHNVQSKKLLEDLIAQAPLFKEFVVKKTEGGVKQEVLDGFYLLIDLFEGKRTDFIGSSLLKMIPQNLLKTRKLQKPLHYPDLLNEIQCNIFPILEEASAELTIFALIAEKIRKKIEKVAKAQDLFFFENLLHLMEEKTQDNDFAGRVRAQFRAVLIDEFQDTDPTQWNIFSRLFNTPAFKGPLYLVGDPKQSIYRFRRADIYTYLDAKNTMGPESQVSLQCNYRSDPLLIEGLNKLFSATSDFISLPRLNSSLTYSTVSSPKDKKNTEWKDGKRHIHICKGEDEDSIYKWIAEEIVKLNENENILLSECAILVKDRYQAKRILHHLRVCNIPAVTKKSRSLITSPAFKIFQKLLECTNDPRDSKNLSYLLGTPLFAYEMDQIKENVEKWKEFFFYLKDDLFKGGIFSFFHKIIELQGENLIKQKEGDEIYQDLLQLVELSASNVPQGDIEQILVFLEHLQREDAESEILQARQNNIGEAVQILTIHVSKGLEFDVIFPVGLFLEASKKSGLVLSPFSSQYCFDKHSQSIEEQESHSERMRQLYVSFTRAKKRLYIPILGNKNSTIAMFMENVLKDESIEKFVSCSQTLSFSECNIVEKKAFQAIQKPHLLTPPPKLKLEFNPIQIHSFSSLTKKMHLHSNEKPNFEKKEMPSNQEMPSNPEMGVLLHYVFENIVFKDAFQKSSPDEVSSLISHLIKGTALEEWEKNVSEIVFNAFHKQLKSPRLAFALADVDTDKILKEVEFIYSSNEPEGYLKGFIDLVFEFEGKIYFLDWKSNYLGPCLGDYTMEKMKQAMDLNNYHMQAKIYKQALQKYLSLFNENGSEIGFGGFFYIFLRGLGGENEGVYYHE